VLPAAEIAAVTGSLVSTVSLLLTELRAHRDKATLSDDEVREALLLLEDRLGTWYALAARTNAAARELLAVYDHPGPSESRRRAAREDLHRHAMTNIFYGTEVLSDFAAKRPYSRRGAALFGRFRARGQGRARSGWPRRWTGPGFLGRRRGRVHSLEALMRVYAPTLDQAARRFADRLDAVATAQSWASPEMLADEERRAAAATRLAELERTQRALSDTRRQVRAFIRDSFPLGA
jgi:hypothetical protein